MTIREPTGPTLPRDVLTWCEALFRHRHSRGRHLHFGGVTGIYAVGIRLAIFSISNGRQTENAGCGQGLCINIDR